MTTTETTNRYGRLCAEIYDLDKPTGSLFDIPYYTGRLKDLDFILTHIDDVEAVFPVRNGEVKMIREPAA